MNVINQVLTQLEQRGVQPAPGESMVRAVVQPPRRSVAWPLMLAGLLVLVVLVVWLALPTPQPKVASGNIARSHAPLQPPVAPVVAAAPAASAAAAVPVASEVPAVQSAPAPALAPVAADIPVRPAPRPAAPAPDCREPCRKQAAHPHPAEGQKTAAKPVAPSAAAANPPPAAAMPALPAPLPQKRVSSAQQADAEFRKAVALMQQGRVNDAIAGYEAALRLDAGHQAARQALVALLLEGGRKSEAERVLQEGLNGKPEQTDWAMLLARLQVDRGALETALATLEKSLPYADAQADYQAFYAALLQRQNRHKEAITHYQFALQLVPGSGVWLMGYGISLQAVQRNEDARDAYRRALESRTLSPELQAFVQQRLKSL